MMSTESRNTMKPVIRIEPDVMDQGVLAVVRYRGSEPLRIELRTKQKGAVARGFAVALSNAKDFPDKPGVVPTLQGLAMRKAEKLEDVDAYLMAADTYARLAHIAFCDDACPLPKAYAGSSPKTTQGEPFPDFYFRGAKLMHAFALLGEAK
jgi:hypothetical protein